MRLGLLTRHLRTCVPKRPELRTAALLAVVVLAGAVLAGCQCCPGSAEEAGLPTRVILHEPAPSAR